MAGKLKNLSLLHHPTAGFGNFKKYSFNRKPNPGMILKAKKFKLNKNNCFMIGIKLIIAARGLI